MKVVFDFRQVPQMSFSYNPFDHALSLLIVIVVGYAHPVLLFVFIAGFA